MPARLLLIRHGETVWNLERRCQGFSDIPLSETGERQAESLARLLSSEKISGIYSSDLVRSKRTADIIAAPHRIMVKMDVRLRELNQGELEGLSLAEMLAGHPELLKRWMQAPADVEMPGGESLRSLQARAWRATEEIVRRHPEGTSIIVAHNLCSLSIICKAIGLGLNKFRSLRIENGSVSELEFGPRGAVLVRINDTAHLDNDRADKARIG